MENAVEIRGLCKSYKNFSLDNVSFSVPKGYVSGFIGENGAGKTTVLKIIMGTVNKGGGEVRLMGGADGDAAQRKDVAMMFDEPPFQDYWTAADIERAMKLIYPRWDSGAFANYLKSFSLSAKQRFKTMSRGMRMKLGLAVSFSHNADLVILDEPTSGLDPGARDEVLDLIREYMLVEGRSVIFSSHITGDLEKIADFIHYIHEGRLIFSGPREELTEKYCILRGGAGDIPEDKSNALIGLRRHSSGFEAMAELESIGGFPPSVICEKPSLDDIMIFMSRKEASHGN